MTYNEIIIWFLMMFPLAYSPGPNNIICAISGTSVGFKRTLPFIFGVNISIIIYAVVLGFGVGELFLALPEIVNVIKFIGAAYLFWLAYKIFRTEYNQQEKEFTELGIKDGFIINSLNAKTITALIMMYSQFITPNDTLVIKVPILTLLVFVLSIGAHFLWTLAGTALTLWLKNDKFKRWQSYIFGLMLFGVGVWLLLR